MQNLIFPAQIYFDGTNFEPPQLLNILKVIKNFPSDSKKAPPTIATLNFLHKDLKSIYEFNKWIKSA